jgi:hypothetical protein
MSLHTKEPLRLLINSKDIIANILGDNQIGFNEEAGSGK